MNTLLLNREETSQKVQRHEPQKAKDNFSRKMAGDMDKTLERATSFYQGQILFYEKRAQESWMAALLTKRKLNEQKKKEYNNNRQIQQKSSLSSSLFQGIFLPLLFDTQPTET